ncbi:MAG: hypothetical protein E7654_05700 [Ruminococcaceae bacterium]|nr:hypothetical protein [Oscillospiraceae bacterium]
MKKRILAFVFAMLLIMEGVFAAPAFAESLDTSKAAEETPTLLFKTGDAGKAWPLSTYTFSAYSNTNLYLYYGTASGTQTRLTGLPTSSDETVLSVEQNGDRVRFRTKKFGTVTLSYTAGSTTYTAEVTVGLPFEGWYSAQERSKKTYVADYTLPRDSKTELWYLSEEGFSYNITQNITASWRMNNIDTPCGTADGVDIKAVKRNAADPNEAARYDVKVTFDGAVVDIPNNTVLQLHFDTTSGLRLTLRMEEVPELQFKTKPSNAPQPLAECAFTLGNSSSIYLYYGAASGTQTALTAGTLTSSNPNLLVVEKDGDIYRLTYKAPGTVTLTYTDGSIKYTAEVSVVLPTQAWFSARAYNAANYITSFTLPTEGKTSLWFLSESGFSYNMVQNLSAVWQVNRVDTPCLDGVTVKTVKRNAADSDTAARYDIEVIIDSDTVDLPQTTSSLKLVGDSLRSSNLSLKMQEKPTLLYKTSTTQKNASPLALFNPSLGSTRDIYLFYGTSSGTQTALTAGTLTSSNENILTVSRNGERYRLTTKSLGTVTLTYTEGGTAYTAEVTVNLPGSGWYTAQTRSAETYIISSSYTLPRESLTTLWFLSEPGFSYNTLQNLSAVWWANNTGTPCGNGVTVTPVKRNAADSDTTARYDIKVTIDSSIVKLPQTNSSLKLVSDSMSSSNLFLKMQEKPALLYKTNLNNSAQPLSSYPLSPGSTPNLYLYYGTSSGTQTALTSGTLTSSDPTILTVAKASDGLRYRLTPKTFGTVTLTYTDGSTVYTTEVTVSLPASSWHTTQTRSEANFITSYVLPFEGQTTLWFMSKNGFTYTEIQGLSTNWLGNGVKAEAVKRDPAAPDATARYDFKVTFDSAILELPSSSTSFRLRYTNANGSSMAESRALSLQMEPKPGLLFRTLTWVSNTPQENPNTKLLSIEQLPIQLEHTTTLRLYYGTIDAHVPVTDLTVLSGKSVKVVTQMASDGGLCWDLKYVEPGETVLQYRYLSNGKSITGAHTLSVSIPEYAFFSAQARTTENYLPDISWFDLENGSIWFLSEDGFTAEERAGIEVKVNYNRTDFSNFSIAWAERPGAAGRYDLKITLPKPPSGELNYSLQIKQNDKLLINDYRIYAAKKMHIHELYLGDYVVGFSFARGEIIDIIEGGTGSMGSTSAAAPSENDPYKLFRDFDITAAEIKTDSEGAKYYEVLPGNKAKITVSKVWIEPLYGTEAVFSLSDKAYVTEVIPNANGSNWELYFKPARYAYVRLWATVTATIEGQTITGDIGVTCMSDYRSIGEYDCALLDILSVEDYIDEDGEFHQGLNSLLQEIVENDKSSIISIRLADIDYVGTITIPTKLGTRLNLHGRTNTRLIGSVDLNEAQGPKMSNICFIAPDRSGSSDEMIAVRNGAGTVNNCVFYDYDVALDTSWKGLVSSMNGNIYINNTIAIRFDIGMRLTGSQILSTWRNNTFINNGTAVQVLSLNKYASSYYFRFTDSNFINNGTDFDVRDGSTIYMYKNYFGEYRALGNGHYPNPGRPGHDKHNGRDELRLSDLLGAKTEGKVDLILKRRPAQIQTTNGAKVVTNPRWKYPVMNWWNGVSLETLLFDRDVAVNPAAMFMSARAEAEYENILVADWENATQIINTDIDAENLLIDGSAFEESGEKKIDIVDEKEKPLGTWIFD